MTYLVRVQVILEISSTSRPSIAIPDAPMPGHCAALVRTIRDISGAGRHGPFARLIVQRAGFKLAGYCDASHSHEIHRAASGFCKSRSGGCIVAAWVSVYAFSRARNKRRRSRGSSPSSRCKLVLLVKNLPAVRRLGAFVLGTLLPTSVVHWHCDTMSHSARP